jgi:tRNA threonylcarbamoyladenosine biosynthesis protein TsaE
VIRLHLDGEAAQESFGRCIAANLESPCLVLLKGELGTGKTTLVRGVLRGLGHFGSVRSPTYTLLEPYEVAGKRLFHLDLYRLTDPDELEFLGLRDLLDGASLVFVEWPERAAGALPACDVEINIVYEPPGRGLMLEGRSPTGERILTGLAAHYPQAIHGKSAGV